DHRLERRAFFDTPVDAVLDKNSFEREEMPLFLEFAQLDLEREFENIFRVACRPPQKFVDAQKPRLAAVDYAGVCRNGTLAVGEGVKRLDHLIRVASGREVHENLDV